MISLRKAMDSRDQNTVEAILSSYRAVLGAIGKTSVQVCPPAGERLQASLLGLSDRLTAEAGPAAVMEAEQQIETHLRQWADGAAAAYDAKAEEVKSLLVLLATAAGEVGARDERSTERFQTVSQRLQATAQLPDVSAMRQAVKTSATELNAVVAQVRQEGQASIAQLRAQLATYEARLEEVERLSETDALTSLANRRSVETHVERRIREGRPFSVLYLDLNGFKAINDTLGHSAGDDLLQQFAGELRTAFRSSDLVGRWGGDEFVAIVEGDRRQADSCVARIQQWIDGEYTLKVGVPPRKVTVTTAVGRASWRPGETIADVLQRADTRMYEDKAAKRASQHGGDQRIRV